MKRTTNRTSTSKSPEIAASDAGGDPANVPSKVDVRTQSSAAAPSAAAPSANRWTFFTNHAHVLIALHADPGLVLREVAIQVGITERAVQRIVQDLEAEGFIRRERVGRKNRYEVLTEEHLRHAVEAHRTIGDLLEFIHG